MYIHSELNGVHESAPMNIIMSDCTYNMVVGVASAVRYLCVVYQCRLERQCSTTPCTGPCSFPDISAWERKRRCQVETSSTNQTRMQRSGRGRLTCSLLSSAELGELTHFLKHLSDIFCEGRRGTGMHVPLAATLRWRAWVLRGRRLTMIISCRLATAI